jgi:hypothetical protein
MAHPLESGSACKRTAATVQASHQQAWLKGQIAAAARQGSDLD